MAATISVRNYLRDTLNFDADTATHLVNEEHCNAIEKFAAVWKSDIDDMCRAVHKTPKPPVVGAAAGAAPVFYKLSSYNSVRLHQLCYYALFLKLTGQTRDV